MQEAANLAESDMHLVPTRDTVTDFVFEVCSGQVCASELLSAVLSLTVYNNFIFYLFLFDTLHVFLPLNDQSAVNQSYIREHEKDERDILQNY